MNTLRSWLGYLVPREEEDPAFRAELARLSLIGLRVIAVICIAAPLFNLLIGALWIPQLLVLFLRRQILVLGLGLAALTLSFLPAVKPYGRLVGFLVGYLVVAVDYTQGLSVFSNLTEATLFLALNLTMVNLVGMSALPLKPMHTLSLGGAILTSYLGLLAGQRLLGQMAGNSLALLVVASTILGICTGLTALIYHQRVATYRARRAALEAFEELRAAQTRLLITHNAASTGRLAAALSHELNSPLGALTSAIDTMLLSVERARERPADRERLTQVFAGAAETARRASDRLKGMLARIERLTNLDRAEVRLVDLDELLRDTLAVVRQELKPEIEVQLDLKPVPPMKARPQQLGAVFSNLLRNAATAIQAGGRIDVVSYRRDQEIVLEVRDNGRGIPAERLARLFEPGFAVQGGRIATTNWDLFVSRSIVAEHGGQLEIESEEGSGTTARITLPLAAGGGPV